MKMKDVLIIGAGIPGCAMALALAKRGISVAVMASDQSEDTSPIKIECLTERIKSLEEEGQPIECSRAMEQLIALSQKSIEELLGSYALETDVHQALQEQLKQMPHVEWFARHTAIELLTLESHSTQRADIYKRSVCLGVFAYDHDSQQVEPILAKETILAAGGAVSLYPYSTQKATLTGDGLAMAHRAGARLLNLDRIQFHPFSLYCRDKPCMPLPKELWALNTLELKEKFPEMEAKGSAAQFMCGGVAVDRVGQTTLQRLRAIGEVACTGLFYDSREEALNVLESLTWALACAEDIARQIPKFIYYFPEIKAWDVPVQLSSDAIKEDWHLLKEIMWHYVGVMRDRSRLKRGVALLQKLKAFNEAEQETEFSIDRMHLINALQVSILMAQEALECVKDNIACGLG